MAERHWHLEKWGVGLLISLLRVLTPAYSQEAAPTEDKAELAEITVTAEKRSESIDRAPSAITRVSGDVIIDLGVESVTDMSGLFPSARFEPVSSSTHLYVRGIGSEQDRISVDQLVNMSVDGVLLPREMDAAALIDITDIELLPGPQGTLYGASSVGGVLSVENNRPTAGSYNKAMFEYGNFQTYHLTDVQNESINDSLSLRGAIDLLNHEGYQTDGAWTANATTVRLSALYTPSEAFSAYVWGLVHTDNSAPSDSGSLSESGAWIPSNNPWDTLNSCITKACNGFSDRPDLGRGNNVVRDYMMAGQFDWHFDGIAITDIPSVIHSHTFQNYYAFVFPATYDVNNHSIGNELRIGSDTNSPLQWLSGLYLYQNKADQLFTLGNFYLPQYTNQDVAPFGYVRYSFTDALRLTVGARYSWTRKEATFSEPNALQQTAATWHPIDGKVGLEYDLNASTLTYLTAQSGSSPGTLDGQDPLDEKPTITKVTRLYSLTGGWKTRLLDNRLQLNNEIFYYDYRDFLVQTIVCGVPATCFPLDNIFINAPKLISWGDQLDLRLQVTSDDQITLGAAYTSAKAGHWITDAGANLSDQKFLEAPEVTVTFGGEHEFRMPNSADIKLRADSTYVSGYYSDFGTQPGAEVHSPVLTQHAFSTTGVSLTYHAAGDKWAVGLWSRNLENKAQIGPGAAFSFGPVQGASPYVNPPRTFGIRVNVNLGSAGK